MSTPVLAGAFRDEWGRIVAALIHQFGDWDLAEDCAQEAFALAAQRWPNEGAPVRPGAWLFTVARNRAIDRLRRLQLVGTEPERRFLEARLAEVGTLS